MAEQRTFVMVKPDGVAKRLVGEVISRLERKGLLLRRATVLTLDEATANRHYEEHLEKAFYPELLEFITSGPVVAMEWSGDEAVSVVRTLVGATNPQHAAPGTIRGDHGLQVTQNIVHAADSPESAARELAIYFPH